MPVDTAAWTTLMQAARAGDHHAYRRLLTDVQTYLMRVLRPRLANPQDAEDIVQTILLAMHQASDTWQDDQPFLPWLHGIVRYKTLDYLRQTYRDADREQHNDLAYANYADPVTRTDQSDGDLERLLAGLTPRQKDLLLYTKVHGHSVAEAAGAFGMSPSAVKVTVHRLIKQLRTAFNLSGPSQLL